MSDRIAWLHVPTIQLFATTLLLAGCFRVATPIRPDASQEAAAPDSSDDATMRNDADAGSAPDADATADTGVELDSAMDSGVDTGADTGVDTGVDTGIEARADVVTDVPIGDVMRLPPVRGLCGDAGACPSGQFCSGGVCTNEYSLHAGGGFQCLKVREATTCWGGGDFNALRPPSTSVWLPTSLAPFASAGSIYGMSSFVYSTEFIIGADRSVGYLGYRHVFGDNTTSQPIRPEPVPVANTSGTLELATGGPSGVRCAITMDRNIRCWGCGGAGSLGDGGDRNCEVSETSTRPVAITLPAPVVQIAIARTYAPEWDAFRAATVCALMQHGVVRCWGVNDVGQRGIGTTDSVTTTSEAATMGANVVGRYTAIAATESSFCAIADSGAVRCWGYDTVGAMAAHPSPVAILRGDSTEHGNVEVLRCSGGACCTLERGSRALYCWGSQGLAGSFGAIVPGGPMTNFIRATRVTPSGLEPGSIEDVSIGPPVCALGRVAGDTTHRRVVCWGDNERGQAGAPLPSARLVGFTTVPVVAPGF
ncbi:MAG: hypothetical protein JNK05_35165 [Myxococcales bacterium]|nr:hypothetical protein [Myxococcales bacterium]